MLDLMTICLEARELNLHIVVEGDLMWYKVGLDIGGALWWLLDMVEEAGELVSEVQVSYNCALWNANMEADDLSE